MTKITIDGTPYMLDMEGARKVGALFLALPLKPGDVYIHPTGDVCPMWLAEVKFSGSNTPRRFQLMGLGSSVNGDAFFTDIHTREEVEEFLLARNMIYAGNITISIGNLVRDLVPVVG